LATGMSAKNGLLLEILLNGLRPQFTKLERWRRVSVMAKHF